MVSVLFDEISLSSEIHYDPNKDQFSGIADGTNRQSQIATSALVAMVTWINRSMKQVVGYWFLSSVGNSNRTHEIIDSTVNKLFDANLIVKSNICDQAPRNQGLIKKFNISENKTSFERFEHKIFLIFDPHLIKSLRNNIMIKILKYLDDYVR